MLARRQNACLNGTRGQAIIQTKPRSRASRRQASITGEEFSRVPQSRLSALAGEHARDFRNARVA